MHQIKEQRNYRNIVSLLFPQNILKNSKNKTLTGRFVLITFSDFNTTELIYFNSIIESCEWKSLKNYTKRNFL